MCFYFFKKIGLNIQKNVANSTVNQPKFIQFHCIKNEPLFTIVAEWTKQLKNFLLNHTIQHHHNNNKNKTKNLC